MKLTYLVTIAILILMPTLQASVGVTDGLVAHYAFEGNTQDSSVNGNDGLPIGPEVYGPGQVGDAAFFDGTSSHVSVLHPIGDLYTASVWFYPSVPVSTHAGGGGLFGRDVTAPSAPYCHVGPLTAQVTNEIVSLLMNFLPNNDSIFYWTGDDVDQDFGSRWHHLVFVWDSDALNYRLYVDGESKGLARIRNEPKLMTLDRMTIGGYGASSSTFLDGGIDEFRVYDRAISANEIWALFHEGTSVRDLLEDLVNTVMSLNLSRGISNSLDAKLDNAIRALDDLNENNDQAAANSLNAFTNAVDAQSCNAIPCADADTLIFKAETLIQRLDCP